MRVHSGKAHASLILATTLAISACASSPSTTSSEAPTSAAATSTTPASPSSSGAAATTATSGGTQPASHSTQAPPVGLDAYAPQVAADLDPTAAVFDYTKLMPTDPVDIASGQKVAIVVSSLASAQAVQFSNAVKSAAEAGGFKATVYDGKYSPQEQAALIQRAVDDDVAGIVLAGVTPSTVPSPIAAASDAHIPVVNMFGYGDEANGVTDVGTDPKLVGASVGRWLVFVTDQKVKAAIFQLPPGGAASVAINAYQDAMAAAVRLCGACSVVRDTFQVSDALDVGTPRYAAFLNAHPAGSLTHVASGFDSGMISYAKTDQALGRTEISTIGGFAASAAGLAEIKAKSGPAVVPAVPLVFVAYAAIDALARRIKGIEVKNILVDAPLITADTADHYPDGVFTANVDYAQRFTELWKK